MTTEARSEDDRSLTSSAGEGEGGSASDPRAGSSGTEGSVVRAAKATTGCRVDLAGGTLDIWPLGLLHPGALTVNVAVDLPVRVSVAPADRFLVSGAGRRVEAASLEELAGRAVSALVGTVLLALQERRLRERGAFLPPIAVEIESASPQGAGLGASSAVVIALIAATEEAMGWPPSTAEQRVALARDAEARLMSLPTGSQDHWPPLLGGALALHHLPGGTHVERLDVDLEALGESLVVAYSGVSHFSAGQNWEVVRRRLNGDPEVVDLFAGIAEVAAAAREALVAQDLPRLGNLMGEEWSLRRRLAPGISVPAVESLLEAARAAGAWGGKACGAGGGGCVAVLAPVGRREEVAGALAGAGGDLLHLGARVQGLQGGITGAEVRRMGIDDN